MKVTRHAARRYVERVKPHLDPDQAAEELDQLLRAGRRLSEPPSWVHESAEGADFWVEISDGIAAVCRYERGLLVVTTVLTRAGHSDEVRAAINKQKARRRRDKRHRRELEHRLPRRVQWES